MSSPASVPLIPAAWGEILDKIAILEIKRARIVGNAAQANILRELEGLNQVVTAQLEMTEEIAGLGAQLRAVNEALWDIEDAIRGKERAQDFGEEFVELARSVYRRNDDRALLKRQINALTTSAIVEEKSYHAY